MIKGDISRLLVGYRGTAHSWECDEMGHLNVSFYFGRASDQAFFLRNAIGLTPHMMRGEKRGTVALQEHARFHREVRAGGLMVGRAGVLEVGDRTMDVYYEFRDADDTLLTTFHTIIGFFDTEARKLVAWPDEVRAKAETLHTALPDAAAPARLPAADSETRKLRTLTQDDAQKSGFVHTGGAGINSWECDQFGHMNTMFYIRRQGEAVPHLQHAMGWDRQAVISAGIGFAVGEMRINYFNELHEGDLVATWSAVRQLNPKNMIAEHRIFNAETGALSSAALVCAVCFDLKTRRATEFPPDMAASAVKHVVPF